MRQVGVLLMLLALASCGEAPSPAEVQEGPAPEVSRSPENAPANPAAAGAAGSRSCRECHERFYELWAPSHHGTAMQPFTAALGREAFGERSGVVAIRDHRYRYELRDGQGWIFERTGEDDAEIKHEIVHVMGGKNVYFLLTPRERGRLQTLPIAYDVNEKAWYDTTASMVRHAVGHTDEPVHWTDPLLTFNTACWSCHVSQLSVNYDAATDTYASVWAEPGINCETCHGPAEDHIRVCREAGEGNVPEDLKLVLQSELSPDQRSDACATCHAKSMVLTNTFQPGDRFFDHFDLACFEDPDFHPDGRDLGENYTHTLWLRSPCVRASEIDCIHCHTSSGRYRFRDENPNGACLPCHQEKVDDPTPHTHHEAAGPGSRCIACHMPMTTFARMRRSDHSMLPPAPAVSAKHGSPDACTICHEEKDAAWADGHVRQWHEEDYQAPRMLEADLIAEARGRDWTRLDRMLEMMADEKTDEIMVASLTRLTRRSNDPRRAEVYLRLLEHASPLVRSSAATALEPYAAHPTIGRALFARLEDDARVVRLRAASALASMPAGDLPPAAQAVFDSAFEELEASILSRPDQWGAHYNHGNFLEQRGRRDEALAAYARAHELRPDQVQPMVNAAMLHARQGDLEEAEVWLRQALAVDAESPETLYNLGLLLGETKRPEEAKVMLARAFEADPTLGRAARNLAALYAGEKDLEAAVTWAAKAAAAEPADAQTVWTHAFYLRHASRGDEAIEALERGLAKGAVSPEVYDLLGQLHLDRKDRASAISVWRQAMTDARLPDPVRQAFFRRLAPPPRSSPPR